MRVLFVIHGPKDPCTAVYAWTCARASLLEARGHRTEVLAPEDCTELAGRPPRWRPLLFPLAVARRLRRSETLPDVAVFHSFSGWAALVARRLDPRLAGLRAITQFHGLEPLHYRAMRAERRRGGRPFRLRFRLFQEAVMPVLLRLACRRSDLVACLNRAERAALVARRWARPEKVVVVPNAAPPEAFVERRARAPLRRLLFLGQWLDGKGVRYLVEAFAALAAERPDLELACVGTRTDPQAVLAAFPADLRDRVRVVASAGRQLVAAELRAADLFVFPTLAEGSSLSLLEAMAAALPIVTTPVGAAPDLLRDGESVLFVPPADAAAIVRAVRRLLADPALAAGLGAQARGIAERHAWERLAPAWTELIEGLAAAPGAPLERLQAARP
ncbi:MAG TPA: glycosyltransferase family 4 protein [Thermoanaerobaculia bacterium]|nr:glycosyltransferase family 4 protein [Thermoanaerobaculia bacterium]